MITEFLMKLASPQLRIYGKMKSERPDLYERMIEMYFIMLKKHPIGALTGSRVVYDALSENPEAIQLASEIQTWAIPFLKNDPEFQQWAEKKSSKLGITPSGPLWDEDSGEIMEGIYQRCYHCGAYADECQCDGGL